MKQNEKAAGKTANDGARVRRYEEKAAQIRARAKEANEHEANELYLAALNTSEMYNAHVLPTVKALSRHMRRGNYSEAGAVVMWRYAVDNLARAYCRIYCGAGVKIGDVFSVADRCAVAAMLADSERETVASEAAEGRAE
jgi:hypothetical protein